MLAAVRILVPVCACVCEEGLKGCVSARVAVPVVWSQAVRRLLGRWPLLELLGLSITGSIDSWITNASPPSASVCLLLKCLDRF